jgi:hypothetical protein
MRWLADDAGKAGLRSLIWDGRRDSGEPVGSGVYYLRFRAGDRSWTRAIVRVR